MNEQALLRPYMVGDEVRMRVEINHRMNLGDVNAFFRHESGHPEIHLEMVDYTEPELLASGGKRSVWYLIDTVAIEHTPGIYYLARLSMTTAAGRTINFHRGAVPGYPGERLRFEVVDEPETRPSFEAVTLEQ